MYIIFNQIHQLIHIVRHWWVDKELEPQKLLLYTHILNEYGELPNLLEPWITRKLINIILHSPCILCYFTLSVSRGLIILKNLKFTVYIRISIHFIMLNIPKS